MVYRLITFDITGTLLKGRKPVGETYAKAGKLFGITGLDPDVLTANFKNEWINMCKVHPNFGLYSGLGWQTWWKHLVRSTFINSGCGKVRDESWNKLTSYLIELYSTGKGWKCEDGAEDLLHCLKFNELEVGVISNFDTRLHNILKDVGLYNFFSFVLTSYETSYLKPDINIFLTAQRCYEIKTGFILEKHCALHVGNSLKHDYVGAKNAGWNAALILQDDHIEKYEDNSHSMAFKNLAEFNKHLVSEISVGH